MTCCSQEIWRLKSAEHLSPTRIRHPERAPWTPAALQVHRTGKVIVLLSPRIRSVQVEAVTASARLAE